MRLDHLLSREFLVLVLGGTGALMAPTVDRSVVRFPSQVGSAGTFGCGRPKRPGEITETRSGIRAKALCHSSRVKGATAQTPSFVGREVGADPAGV